jgi:hypothetical protein
MALRPGLRTIDPATLPIDKMPISKLREVVPEDSPLGKGLAELPVEEIQAQLTGSAAGEETIGLLGIQLPDQAELF